MKVVTIKGNELELVPRAKLDGAMLRDLVLDGVDLSGSSLRGAIFNESWLVGANLSGCDLTGANFYGADLRGADLSGSRLDGCYWNEVTWSASTRWPDGRPPVPAADPLKRSLLENDGDQDDSGLPTFVLVDASEVVGVVRWPRSIVEGISRARRFTRTEQASVYFRLAFNMMVALHERTLLSGAPLMSGFMFRDEHLFDDHEEVVEWAQVPRTYGREVALGHCTLMLAALGFRAVRANEDGTLSATFEPVVDLGAWLRDGRFGLFELLARRALDHHFGTPEGAWSDPVFETDDEYAEDDDEYAEYEDEEEEEDGGDLEDANDDEEGDDDVEDHLEDDDDDDEEEDEFTDDADLEADAPLPDVYSNLFFSKFDPSWTVRDMVDHLEGDAAVNRSWRLVDRALSDVRPPTIDDDPVRSLRTVVGNYVRAAAAWHAMDGLVSRFEDESEEYDVLERDRALEADADPFVDDVMRLLGIVSTSIGPSGIITATLRPPMNVRATVDGTSRGDLSAVTVGNPLDEDLVVMFPSLGLFEHVIGLSAFPAYGEVDLPDSGAQPRSSSPEHGVGEEGLRSSWW